MFIVECQKNQAKVRQTEPITSGSRNVYVVQFKLSEEWDPLIATAVFMAGSRIINVLLDDDRECMVPWEVMQYAGEQVMVGVFGTMDGNVVLPTIWASMGNLQQGVVTGIYQTEPTPSTYLQIINQLNRLKSQIENGIPYAIDGIVNTTITSVGELPDLEFPRQVIMLNSNFTAKDGTGLSFNNGIVHLEYVDYFDTENNKIYAIRVTDYDGNVYDIVYDRAAQGSPFTTLIQIRNGDIRNDYELARSEGFTGTLSEWLESLKGKDGLNVVYYTGSPVSVDDGVLLADHNLIVPATNFTRKPVVDDEVMIPVQQSETLYFGVYKAISVGDNNVTFEPKVVTRVSAKDGNDALYYLDGAISISDDANITTDYNDQQNASFSRTPVVGDVLMTPVVQGGVTYFVIWKVENVLNEYSRLTPQSVTRVSPIDGKDGVDGRNPIYYIGDIINVAEETDGQLVDDHTIPNIKFTRTPVNGDVVTIPLEDDRNSFLITYSAKEIGEDNSVWQVVNILNTTGRIGMTGLEALWGNFKLINKPYEGKTVYTNFQIDNEVMSMADLEASPGVNDEETHEHIDNPFNRVPINNEVFSGVAISKNQDTSFACYVTGTVYVDTTLSDNTQQVIITFDSVTDIGNSPNFITSNETVNYLKSEEDVTIPDDGVMGIDSLTGLREFLANFSSSDITWKLITIEPDDWTLGDSVFWYRILYHDNSVGLESDVAYYYNIFLPTVQWDTDYLYTSDFYSIWPDGEQKGVTFFSKSRPTDTYKLLWLILKQPSDTLKHWDTILNTHTIESIKGLIDETTQHLLNLSSPVTTSSTDYTAQRARAISLHTTMPSSGLINGALYGIYS